ncbi:MAG TPA: DUF885 family protein [Steroidobacteraceae bacterium]|nr:DUF885 family protein [Steroidobacteraceae bacterium]
MKTLIGILLMANTISLGAGASPSASYQDLTALFAEWQAFERPPLRDGAPDYTAATAATRFATLKAFQARLTRIDPHSWPVDQQVDFALVRAELNGMEFDFRVLKPWERDPAYYKSIWTEKSDTPAHEGPTHHDVVELWMYSFPLSHADERKLAKQIDNIAPLLRQARLNLTGNARDLWITGTGTMKTQVADLDALATTASKSGPELKKSISAAKQATQDFIGWLESQAPSKTGPSGVGKEHYTWALQNVFLVPMSWDEEVTLLKRELARAHASLRLEEERNRGLPELVPDANAEVHRQRGEAAVSKYMAWLRDKDILTIAEYLDPAMRAHIDPYVAPEQRNFFSIVSHHEPMALYAHFYHWFDHAWMVNAPNPSPIRRGALDFNIWDNRAEGMATAMEELILHMGYYDDNPRAREVVWIMLAQRCARGLASLYSQANEFDIQQAKAFQVEWTPRGWMHPELDLLGFEQQLYLRQPTYGTSYVTGKAMIEELIRVRSHQLGKDFTMRRFFDEFNGAGVIPVSLIRWQLTGRRADVASAETPATQ